MVQDITMFMSKMIDNLHGTLIGNFQTEYDNLTSRMLLALYDAVKNLAGGKIDFGKSGAITYGDRPVRSISAEPDGIDKTIVFEMYRRDNKTETETIRVSDGGNFSDIAYWLNATLLYIKRGYC